MRAVSVPRSADGPTKSGLKGRRSSSPSSCSGRPHVPRSTYEPRRNRMEPASATVISTAGRLLLVPQQSIITFSVILRQRTLPMSQKAQNVRMTCIAKDTLTTSESQRSTWIGSGAEAGLRSLANAKVRVVSDLLTSIRTISQEQQCPSTLQTILNFSGIARSV